MAKEDAPSIRPVDAEFVASERDIGDLDGCGRTLNVAIAWSHRLDGYVRRFGGALLVCRPHESDHVRLVAHDQLVFCEWVPRVLGAFIEGHFKCNFTAWVNATEVEWCAAYLVLVDVVREFAAVCGVGQRYAA